MKQFINDYRRVVYYLLGGDEDLAREVISQYKSKCLFYYASAQKNEIEYTYREHRKIKRIWPVLLVKFKLGGAVFGSGGAPIVVDLDKGELGIPALKIKVKISKSVCEELRYVIEHYAVSGRGMGCVFGFTAQIVYKKIPTIRIIARRLYKKPVVRLPVLIIAVDVNSRYGFVVRVFFVDEGGVRVFRYRFQPPNHELREEVKAVLQSLFMHTRKPVYAYQIKLVCGRIKSLNREFARKLVYFIRRIGRYYRDKYGATIVVLVDSVDPNSLKNTRLQRTLLRTIKAIKNLCLFERFTYWEFCGVSGRICPFCSTDKEKVEMEFYYSCRNTRFFTCPKCGFTADRDALACWRMALIFLKTCLPEAVQLLKNKLLELWWKSKPPYSSL